MSAEYIASMSVICAVFGAACAATIIPRAYAFDLENEREGEEIHPYSRENFKENGSRIFRAAFAWAAVGAIAGATIGYLISEDQEAAREYRAETYEACLEKGREHDSNVIYTPPGFLISTSCELIEP